MTLTLSEAILLGSVGTRQYRRDFMGADGSTCALGSALVAVGFLTRQDVEFGRLRHAKALHCTTRLHDLWPILGRRVPHPAKGIEGMSTLACIIPDLNDHCGWTRPQIAAWVKTIEEQVDAEQTAPEKQAVSVSA